MLLAQLLRFATGLIQFYATEEFDLPGEVGGCFPPLWDRSEIGALQKIQSYVVLNQYLTSEHREILLACVFGWTLAVIGVEGRLRRAPRRKMQPTA